MTKTSKFWEPGCSLFLGELEREESSRLSSIEEALKRASEPAAIEQLKKERAAVKAEFKAKRDGAKHSLFVTQ